MKQCKKDGKRPPRSSRVFVYKGKEPRLSAHAKRHLAARNITLVLIPANGRERPGEVINHGE